MVGRHSKDCMERSLHKNLYHLERRCWRDQYHQNSVEQKESQIQLRNVAGSEKQQWEQEGPGGGSSRRRAQEAREDDERRVQEAREDEERGERREERGEESSGGAREK